MRYELRPLGTWTGAVTRDRAGSSRFRAAWTDTLDLLGRETELLGANVVVLQVDVETGDIRRDGMLRANAKVGFPGVRVSFDSRHGPLTYATDRHEKQWPHEPPGWQANIRAIALALQALRAVDRYGITKSGEQYRGWTAIAATPADTALTVDEAARVLADAAGIDPATLTHKATIAAAFRAAARTAHPDVGGNAEAATDQRPAGSTPRASHSAASDCRAWWPACADHSYGDPALSADAARYVPQEGGPR